MRFHKLDLNLLVALDVLLEERSVSLAAERLYLSQSATSSALGRLREYFGDELMVVRGRQMILTARAEELVEPVRAVLKQVKDTIALKPVFDPETSDRSIRIMASDYISEVLLSTVMCEVTAKAPNLRLEIMQMMDSPTDVLDRGMVDILLTVDYAISSNHPSELLFEDDYVIIGCAENKLLQNGKITEAEYYALGHVSARFGKGQIPAFEDWFARRQKHQRKLEIITPSFLSIPAFVIGTQRIATVHRRHAERIKSQLPITVVECPMAFPPIREAIQWHVANNNDPAIRWFVEQVVLSAGEHIGKKVPDNVISMPNKRAVGKMDAETSAQLKNDYGTKK